MILVASDDHRAVVEGRARREYRHENLLRDARLDRVARPAVLVEPDIVFERNDRADPPAHQQGGRLDQLVDDAPALELGEEPEHPGRPESRQRRPQLGLKDDEQSDRPELEERLEDRRDEGEVQEPGQEVDDGEEAHAEEHLHRPGALQQEEEPVDEGRHDHDLHEIAPPGPHEQELLPEDAHGLPPAPASATAWATASASTAGRTSWTRNSRAPPR